MTDWRFYGQMALPAASLSSSDRVAFRTAGAFHVARIDGAFVLTGELDLATVPSLRGALEPALQGGGRVVVDCSELTFADSAGVMALVDASRTLGERGTLVLRSPKPLVRRVVGVLGLDQLENLEISGVD